MEKAPVAASLTLFLTCYNVNVAPKPLGFMEGALKSIRGQKETVECQIRIDRLYQNKQDTYFTETVQSPNPAFSLGIQLPLQDGRAYPDEHGRVSLSSDVLSFTLTRTQDNYTVGSATMSVDLLVTMLARHVMTDHVPFEMFGKASKKSGGDPALRITVASIAPTRHPVVRTQNPLLQAYMFPPATSSDSRRKLVMEEVMEPEYQISMPFLFLRCMHAELTQASELWNIRCLNERKKQLIFECPDDALAAGCDVFEVTIRGGKNLKADNATGFSDAALMNPYVVVEYGETMMRASSSIDESTTESSRRNTDVVCLGRTMAELNTNDPNFSRQRTATLSGRSTSLPPSGQPPLVQRSQSSQEPPPPAPTSQKVRSPNESLPSSSAATSATMASAFTFYRKSNGPTTSSKGAFVFKVFHEVLNKKDPAQQDFAVGQCVVGWNITKPEVEPQTYNFSIDQWVSIYPAVDRRSMYNDREDLGKLHVQIRIRCSTVKFALQSESGLRTVEKSPLYRLADLNKDHKLRKLTLAMKGGATNTSGGASNHGLSSESLSGRLTLPPPQPTIQDVQWHADTLKMHLKDVEEMLDHVNTQRSLRTTFRPSVAKKDKLAQPLATNLHLSYFTTYSDSTARGPPVVDNVSVTVTCGAPTPHGLPDKRGLLDLEDIMMTNGTSGNLTVVDQTRQVYFFRKILCVSQSVTVLVTSFMAMLEQACCGVPGGDQPALHQWATYGFLLQWESLVSSQGKEYTMLNDSWIAIKTLGRFTLHLVEQPEYEHESTATPIHMETTEDQKGYVLHIPVPRTVFAMLPEVLQNGQHINVVPVLFSQGINEMQTVANLLGSSAVDLQHNINKLCTKSVEAYVASVLDTTQLPMHYVTRVNELLATLKSLVTDETRQTAKKNYRLLLVAADLTRQLRGGRVTFCKSGKDRTAMSVTLEQTRMVHNTSSEKVDMYDTIEPIADVMREYGVRIKVAEKNVGRPRYTFNGLQRKMLPRVYRPPTKSIQGGADLS